MNHYVIQMWSHPHERFIIPTPNYLDAIAIFKTYGQYQAHHDYSIYNLETEIFFDMIREDINLITFF